MRLKKEKKLRNSLQLDESSCGTEFIAHFYFIRTISLILIKLSFKNRKFQM